MDILTLVIIIALIGIANIGLLLWMKFGATSDTSVNINKSILKFLTDIGAGYPSQSNVHPANHGVQPHQTMGIRPNTYPGVSCRRYNLT